ncbi:MAG: hypothetical protein JRN06_06125 [Nitrososphaerota archaeon]|nr:hypothetical protein [Nitrososphaerota archaeon]
MDLMEGKDLKRRMMESYSRNPKGWSFVLSPSPRFGFFDAAVSGPDTAWMLKLDTLFKPAPIVIGSEVEAFRRRPRGPFSYGYRALPPELALQIVGGGEAGPREGTLAELMSVMRSEPVAPEMGRAYAEGPLVLTGPGQISLSKSQKEMDERLASEMRRLLRLRYPSYG